LFSTPDILVSFVVPPVVCAAILTLAWRPWRRGERAVDARWANAIALGIAYAIGYARLVGDLAFPPADPDTWILCLMPIAMAAGILFCMIGRAPILRLACVTVICAVLSFLLIRPLIGQPLSRQGATLWTAGGAILMTLWWLIFNSLAMRAPRLLAPLVGLIVAAGAAAILGDGGMALRGGFPLMVLTLGLAATSVVAAVAQRFKLAGGGTLAVTLVFVGTILYAYHYVYPEPGPRMVSALDILITAPLLALVILLPRLRNWSDWLKVSIAIAIVVLAVAAAAIIAGVGRHPPQDQSEVARL
jgi:hypothetical protein